MINIKRIALILSIFITIGYQCRADDRLAKAFREDRAGWNYVHLEGSPRDIGYQHGCLLAAETDESIRALKHDVGATKWTQYRGVARQLFWTRLDPEYRDEIEGISEGLRSKGFNIDAQEILAYNSHIEIGGYCLPARKAKQTHARLRSFAPMACSAFVATGSATADGKIVMGHNLWWGYLMGQRWHVLLDIKPEKGNRVLMDALPGFIHSGSDFAINSAGILITETTIGGFMGFDEKGLPEFMRMRKAVQYANSLDEAVKLFRVGNNGGYANTWLLGDTKTNEIGKLELGLKNVIFYRSSDGAYTGANYPEDEKLAREECEPGAYDNPSSKGRRIRWQKVISQNKGKITAEMGKTFLADTFDELQHKVAVSGCTLCGRGGGGGAVNTKVVSSDMARSMTIWARRGFTDGTAMTAAHLCAQEQGMKRLLPYLKDIDSYPWELFTAKNSASSR